MYSAAWVAETICQLRVAGLTTRGGGKSTTLACGVSTLYQDALPRHLNTLADLAPAMAKADLKKVEARRAIGRVVARVFELAGKTQKEAAALLGHKSEATVSRWIAGTERPHFDELESVEAFAAVLVIAWAEVRGHGVEVETIVRVRREA